MTLDVKRHHAIVEHLGRTFGEDIGNSVHAIEDWYVAEMLRDESPCVIW